MIIKAMIERENFYELLTNTMQRYYKNVENIDVKVSFSSKKSDILVFEGLGSIHQRHTSREIFHYWMREYNVRNNIIKYILAKGYVTACFVFKDLFAKKYMHISKPLFNKNIFIYPSNRKIRIFNMKNNTVDAIIKDGFTKRYFKNELDFRLNTKYEFVPKIILNGDDWYREPVLEGLPLARVRNKNKYNSAISTVIKYLKKIKIDTEKLVDNYTYIHDLYQRIDLKLAKAKQNKNIKYYDDMLAFSKNMINLLKNIKYPIKTVLSHGDLQTGNIWWSPEKIYIIDWETNAYRSEWYDYFIMFYSLRRSGKLADLLKNIKNGTIILDSYSKDDLIMILALVCLEDIEFYLDDMLELPKDFGYEIFDRISNEFLRMEW